MAVTIITPIVYGVDGADIQVMPAAFVTTYDPGASDTGPIGCIWVNSLTNTVWQLASLINGVNTWTTSPASGSGIFTDVEVTTGDLTVDMGNVDILLGDLTLGAGSVNIAGDLTVAGVATFNGDIDITSADLIDLTSTANLDPSIQLRTNGGVVETISILNSQGVAADSIKLTSTAGGITLTSNLATADGINLNAIAGGVDIDAALQINIASSRNAADAIVINASAGGIDMTNTGTAGEDIDIASTGASVNITASEAVADAVVINASNASGGVKIRAGTGGIAIADEADTTPIGIGNIAPTASRTTTISGGTVVTAAVTDTLNLGTGGATTNANSVKTVNLGTGNVATGENNINIGTGTAASGTHAVNIATGTGGGTKSCNIGNVDGLTDINILGTVNINTSGANNTSIGTGTYTGNIFIGNALAGPIQVDSADTFAVTAVNGISLSNTGVQPVGLDSAGPITLLSTDNVAGAIALTVNAGVAETLTLLSSQGTGADSISITSTAGGLTFSGGLATADAINLVAAAGGIDWNSALQSNIDSSQAAANAIRIIASNAAGGIDIDCGTAGIAVDSTGAVSLQGAAASDFSVSGAGIDLSLVSSAGSIIINAGEAVVDAIQLTSAAGGLAASLANTVAISNSAGNITLNSAAGTVLLDAAGVLELNSSGGVISIANDAVSQNVNIATAGTRAVVIGNSTATTSVSINGGTGASVNIGTNATVHTTTVGSSTGASTVNLQGGTGGINLNALGIVTIASVDNTIASPTASTTIDANVGSATFTGFTTAAAASQEFTISNSLVTTGSQILVSACNEGANDAQMTVMRVKRGAGSFVVTLKNNGAAALNGNVCITFFVLN